MDKDATKAYKLPSALPSGANFCLIATWLKEDIIRPQNAAFADPMKPQERTFDGKERVPHAYTYTEPPPQKGPPSRRGRRGHFRR